MDSTKPGGYCQQAIMPRNPSRSTDLEPCNQPMPCPFHDHGIAVMERLDRLQVDVEDAYDFVEQDPDVHEAMHGVVKAMEHARDIACYAAIREMFGGDR